MKIAHTILVTLTIILNAGCSTGYHANGFTGGFEDVEYQPGQFRIAFRGNGYTSSQRASDMALLHAADVCLQHGYPYFVIVGAKEGVDTSSFSTPGTATTYGTANAQTTGYYSGGYYSGNTSASGYSTTVYNPGQTFYVNRPHSDLVIQCSTNRTSASFNASALQFNLRQHYHIKAPETPVAQQIQNCEYWLKWLTEHPEGGALPQPLADKTTITAAEVASTKAELETILRKLKSP